ncbi:YceD family protein [Spiroplasma culicicola]|uniref:DUF177 domain-containing protein n=1 Tax=Spiroplasma culicicola AES-1 TaxID=1276246 RepID=W6A816_9MOLU|nr:YceD family protein [Spiroplasma culicicola]AHI53132.1 hypothetical protein SCULI_v1c07910 [Spiroplasma culicicola AES-1]
MLKKEIELKQHIDLDISFENQDRYDFAHDLIEQILDLKVKGTIDYQENIKCVYVNAIITATIKAIDARDGELIELKEQTFDWDEEYFFESQIDDQHNIVMGEEFDIYSYAIEQIVLNIPVNLTNNYGKISLVGNDFKLMSEDEYQQEQDNKIDPRWEKLKEFNFEK